MSLKQKIVHQYLFSVASRFLMMVIKIPLTFFLIHQLRQQEYGFYGMVVAALGIWVAVSDLGWGDYLRRELPAVPQDTQKKMLKNAASMHLVWTVVLLSVGIWLWKTHPLVEFGDLALSGRFCFSLALLLVLGGFFPLIQIYLNYSKSIEDFNKVSLLQMAVWLFSLGTIFFLTPLHLEAVLWTWSFSYAVSYLYFFSKYRFFFFGKIERLFLVKSLRFGFPLCAWEGLKKFSQYYDRFLLGAFAGLSDVAFYHLFNTVFEVAERANQITLHPYIYQAHDENQISRRNRLITTLLKSRILIQSTGITLACLVIFYIPHVLPEQYRTNMSLFWLIGATSILRTAATTVTLSLLLEKKSTLLLFSNALGLVTSIFLNLKLIPLYQAYGAAFSLLGSTLVTTLFQLLFLRIWEYLDFKHFFSLQTEVALLQNWFTSLKRRNKDSQPE